MEAEGMQRSRKRQFGVSLNEQFPTAQTFGAGEVRVGSCCSNAKQCREGDVYVALVDEDGDGHEAAHEAIQRGAVAVLSERFLPVDVPVYVVDDTRIAYGQLCQRLAGQPADALRMIGVTGTNGKTTTSMLIASVLDAAEQRVGVTSTLGYSDSVDNLPANRTTPVAPELASWLRRMQSNGCSHAVVELSSRGLSEQRAAGIQFDAAILTNLRRDHLDVHGSVKNYRRAKARLFDQLKSTGFAVVNVDDPGSQHMLPKRTCPVITVGQRQPAEVSAHVLERHASEQTFLVRAGNESIPVRTQMIGDAHVSNCLAAAAMGLAMGIDLPTIVRGLEAVKRIPSRLDRIECGQDFSVYVDSADTPDRLAVCLQTMRQVTRGRVLCVYSAGDERPEGERPLLGRVAENAADIGIITNSGRQREPSLRVAHDILDGYERPAKAHAVPSRINAIQWALEKARPGDALLIAGGSRTGWLGEETQGTDDLELARTWLHESGDSPGPKILTGAFG
jgi:UDP-N-acetylmuramoyl-L-alanyl-D-glutamate--2,6-diaminopimelate ligase